MAAKGRLMAMLEIDGAFLAEVTPLSREDLLRLVLELHAARNETKRKNLTRHDSAEVSRILVESLDAVFPTHSDKSPSKAWGEKTKAQRTLVVFSLKQRLIQVGFLPPSVGK